MSHVEAQAVAPSRPLVTPITCSPAGGLGSQPQTMYASPPVQLQGSVWLPSPTRASGPELSPSRAGAAPPRSRGSSEGDVLPPPGPRATLSESLLQTPRMSAGNFTKVLPVRQGTSRRRRSNKGRRASSARTRRERAAAAVAFKAASTRAEPGDPPLRVFLSPGMESSSRPSPGGSSTPYTPASSPSRPVSADSLPALQLDPERAVALQLRAGELTLEYYDAKGPGVAAAELVPAGTAGASGAAAPVVSRRGSGSKRKGSRKSRK